MKFLPPNSSRPVNVNISEYIVDWDRVVSAPQKRVKDFLRPYWSGHVVVEEFRVPRTLWRIDLMSLTSRVAVEVSPSGSHSFNKFFHRTKAGFGAAMQRELDKVAWMKKNNIKLCEVFDEDFDELSPAWFLEHYNVHL